MDNFNRLVSLFLLSSALNNENLLLRGTTLKVAKFVYGNGIEK